MQGARREGSGSTRAVCDTVTESNPPSLCSLSSLYRRLAYQCSRLAAWAAKAEEAEASMHLPPKRLVRVSFFLISNVRRHGLPAQGRPLSGALPCKKNRLANRAGQLRQAIILRNPCLNCARKAFWGRGTSPARGSPKLKFHHCSEDNNDEIFAWWLWVFSLWRRRPEPKA